MNNRANESLNLNINSELAETLKETSNKLKKMLGNNNGKGIKDLSSLETKELQSTINNVLPKLNTLISNKTFMEELRKNMHDGNAIKKMHKDTAECIKKALNS